MGIQLWTKSETEPKQWKTGHHYTASEADTMCGPRAKGASAEISDLPTPTPTSTSLGRRNVRCVVNGVREMVGSLGRKVASDVLSLGVDIPPPYKPHKFPPLRKTGYVLKGKENMLAGKEKMLAGKGKMLSGKEKTLTGKEMDVLALSGKALALAGYWDDLAILTHNLGDLNSSLMASVVGSLVGNDRTVQDTTAKPEAHPFLQAQQQQQQQKQQHNTATVQGGEKCAPGPSQGGEKDVSVPPLTEATRKAQHAAESTKKNHAP
ncbi:hypothetical protein Pmani_012097 [Petrolisthes manimaculis]|uniref:Uncharacterized protein n=1 Tax=Petrolisthes manimaculis TaxID=1843537 RepID=A0AAE1Q1I7_9EUCA|nr:hypothetical protein Pmani_012097 [Petrolisthes manimaculis]